MTETILHEYRPGIRYNYTMSAIVCVIVSGGFWFFASVLLRNPPHDVASHVVGIALVLIPVAYLYFIFTRRPRAFRLIRKKEGLFVRWNNGREVRLKSTQHELKPFRIDKVDYGACIVETDTRNRRLRLCFHNTGEAHDFADTLSRQRGRTAI